MDKDTYLIFETYQLNGKAEGLSLENLAQKHKVDLNELKAQLAKGIKTEHEHTKNDETARKIAMDHLAEDPKYYDKLAEIEASKNENEESKDHKARMEKITRDWVNIFHRTFGPGYKEELEKGGLDPYEFFTDYYIAFLKDFDRVSHFAKIYNEKYPTHKVDLDRLQAEIDKIKDKPLVGYRAPSK